MEKERRRNASLIVTIFLSIALMASTILPAYAQDRYYVGYFYYAREGWPPAYGVKCRIYTIDRSFSGEHFYCQWPAVVLSYTYKYWLQMGYSKDHNNSYQLRFYWEYFDSSGWGRGFFGWPVAGNWYQYWISKNRYTGAWSGGVSGQPTHDFGRRSPNLARDYQAQSEMTTSSINIDGTHFNWLSYKINDVDWRLWNRHIWYVDWPYWINQISHYEFMAGGGG